MALEAIKSDLDPEINHRKLETAHGPGYEEPQKLRLTKGPGATSKLSQEKDWTELTGSYEKKREKEKKKKPDHK